MKRYLRYTAIVGVASLVVGGTLLFGTRNDFGLGRNMEIMVNLMREISTAYVDETSPDELVHNGAEGMTRHLDPYSVYMSADEMKDFQTMATGRYGGIGSLIRQKENGVMIAEPYKNSPADRAGLQIGDRFLTIDGEDATAMTTAEVSSRLRGEAGTTVRVKVAKVTGGEAEYKLRRERIVIPSITYYGYVADGVGYIRHSDFTDTCYDDMRSAINALQKEGELRSLILDYRNNGGGVMQSAVKILSLFVPSGTKVLEMKGRARHANETYSTEYEPLLPDTPLAVLINGNSASAAEIVSGALQDMDRGVLIGTRSFGKGLVQTTLPLGFGSYAKLTTAKYYIPSGRCVQARRYSADGRAEMVPDSLIGEFQTRGGRKVYDGGGVAPDIEVKSRYTSAFAATLYLLGIVEDYGDIYFRSHQNDKVDPRTFSITDADYADFVKMVEGRDVPYKSESRRALETLRRALERERYNETSADALRQIDESLHDDKMSNLSLYRSEIVEQINSNIILRYAYARGVVEASLDDDPHIQRAVELLANPAEYNRILAEQDTPKRHTGASTEETTYM